MHIIDNADVLGKVQLQREMGDEDGMVVLELGQFFRFFQSHKLERELTAFTIEACRVESAGHARQEFEEWGRSRMLDYRGGACEEGSLR